MSDQAAKSNPSSSRSDFVEVVEKSTEEAPASSPEERRAQLLAYRAKVEQARLAQEERLTKLAEAQRRIEAELAAFERKDAERQAREQKLAEEARAAAAEETRLEESRKRAAAEAERKQAEREKADLAAKQKEQAERARKLEEEAKRAEAERLTLEAKQKEQDAAAAREAAAQAKLIEERRKQVDSIQQHYMDALDALEVPTAAPAPAKTPAKPPAVPKKAGPPNARRAPRFDIHAVVRFGSPPDDFLMRAKNISMTGALLATEPGTMKHFPVASEHDATVFIDADPKERVVVHGRVVRHEDNAIVIDWSADVESSFRVALLIATLPGTT